MRLLEETLTGREEGMAKGLLLKLPFWVKRGSKHIRVQAKFPFAGPNGLLASDFAQLQPRGGSTPRIVATECWSGVGVIGWRWEGRQADFFGPCVMRRSNIGLPCSFLLSC